MKKTLHYDTANARLRIVAERVDFFDNLILSVTVLTTNFTLKKSKSQLKWWILVLNLLPICIIFQIGPPNPIFLKSNDKSTWEAKDVADSVLSDKSALVIYYLLHKV